MPDSISAINNHVSTFIYHTGVSVKAEWSPGGTTSGATTIMMAFVNYFRMAYAPLKYVSRYAYNEAAWNSLLQNELLSNRPVYYQGFGTGGHAFVCDGVDEMNLYHFNWGWNGAYNGYFALNDLTPGSYNFTSGQGAIIGIGPNDGSTVVQDTTWFDTVTNLVNIAVPDAITLTLGAGSNIRFAANCRLKVWGRLVSVSTPLAYTKLTALNPADGWEGIDWHDDFDRMSDNDSSKLVFTQVEYSKSAAIDCIAFGKVLVDHCRINNNYADQNFQYPGIRAQYKPVTIRNSEIYNNGAGAIAFSYTGSIQAEISGNDIHHNSAPKGGGIMLSNSGSAIYGNSIHHNTATSSGGGIYVMGNLQVITNNTIVNNYAGLQGGGIYLENSNARILNNLLANNSAGSGGYASGGAINCLINSSPLMIGNTIVNNNSLYGGGLNLGPDCYPLVKNCILYGNQSTVGSQVALEDYTSDPVFDHCDVEGGVAGFGGWGSGNEYDTAYYTNNIDVAPQFISPSAGAGFNFDGMSAEWQLQSGSPCTDTGDSTGISSQIPSLDLAGNSRYNGIIDMGAYEFFAVPQNLVANSDTIPPGISVCLNAMLTITVGGSGKSFLVQPGGAALMYAGTKISLLPGTTALSGSYVQCQITPSGPWCPGTAMPSSAGNSSNASETGSSEIPDGEIFKVFPNPTSGIINLEFRKIPGAVPAFVRCYNMQGVCIFSMEFSAGSNFEVPLSGQPSGMYLVTVQIGHEMEMKKILKHPF
jgi:hypothetical protein